MPGQSYTLFGDAMAAITQARVNDPNKLMNEVQKQGYPVTKRLFKGEGKRMIRAGKQFEYNIMFDDVGTDKFVHPHEKTDWTTRDLTAKATVYHRFMQNHDIITDQEKEITDSGKMTAAGVAEKMFDLASVKEQGMWTNHIHGFARNSWAIADKSTMEASDGKQAYSIPAFVNEETNGLFNYLGGTGAWTTIAGIDPTVRTAWKCYRKGYGTSGGAGQDGFDHTNAASLFNVFEDIFLETQFQAPGSFNEYFQNDTLYQQVIITQKQGVKAFTDMLRQKQDLLVGNRQDPAFPNGAVHGIPLEWDPFLETATLYNSGSSTLVVSTSADLKGPRFYFLNFNAMNILCHPEYYFKVIAEEKLTAAGQPNVTVMVAQTWWNIMPMSLRRQAIAYPLEDHTDYA